MHSPSPHSLSPDLQQSLYLALEYRKGGRPAEAEGLYRQLLLRFPGHSVVLNQLGELLMQQGQFQGALPLLEQARENAPGHAENWLVLAQCLLGLDRAKDAKKLISEAIAKGLRHPLADELLRQARSGKKKMGQKPVPLNESLRQLEGLLQAGHYAQVEKLGQELQRRHAKSPQLSYLLGMAVLLQGRLTDAVPLLRRAVQLDPRYAPAQFNLGFALEGTGCPDEAVEAYQRSVAVAPQLVEAHNNLGNALKKLQRHEEALEAYSKALALRPGVAEYHINRGEVLRVVERYEEALAAFETAVRLRPGFAEAYVNLGSVLQQLGRSEEALNKLQNAVELKPDYFEARQAMGHILRRLGRHGDAAEAYRHAAELRPGDAVAHKDLGIELQKLGRYDEAIAMFRRALELKPEDEFVINLLANALMDTGCRNEAFDTYRRGVALIRDGGFPTHSNLLLALNFQAEGTAGGLLAEARAFGKAVERRAVPFSDHGNSPDPDRRLRVGLVSGDLGQHSVGFFLRDVIANLDRDRVELFAYETARRDDELNRQMRRSIAHWRELSVKGMTDEMRASTIRADGIDVLIDLAGHTANNRLPLFAWKPAPVQVSWLGYLGTTGLCAMDYILADPWALPIGEEGQFTETPWRLPETYICFSPPDVRVPVETLPALGEGHITFGCFNNLNKITDHVVACWARVLQAVPQSRLFLKTRSLRATEVRESIVARFSRHGVNSDRLMLDGQFASHEGHFLAYSQVDIALDPFPYPGITTSVEALWMGVPVLSLKGDRFLSHQGETILHNVGLPEWIATDENDYVAKAAAFSSDVKALASLRAGLRERLLVSPLCDAPRFARNFENALRGMWQKWCEQQKPPEATS